MCCAQYAAFKKGVSQAGALYEYAAFKNIYICTSRCYTIHCAILKKGGVSCMC